MKILLINDNHTKQGGAEKYFFQLKNKLSELPHTQVFSLGFADKEERGEDYFILKKINSNLCKLIWRFVINPAIYLKIRHYVKKINPDVIHLHNLKQYPLSVLAALRNYRVVQTTHDYGLLCPTAQNIHRDGTVCLTGIQPNCFWQHRVKFSKLIFWLMVKSFFRIRRHSQRIIIHYIAPSPHLAACLRGNYFSSVSYVPPFIKNNQSEHRLPKEKHFLFAGNLGSHKGGQLLLDEFSSALQVDNQLHLTIAGVGPEEAAWKDLVKKLGISEKVRFVGWQTDIRQLYLDHVALIFPSIGLESFGLVITEAMSYGRAVIAVNRGTAAWLVEDEVTGLLFDVMEKGALAKQILRLGNDINFALKLGNAGKESLKRFDDDNSLRKIVDVYQSVITGSRGKAGQAAERDIAL